MGNNKAFKSVAYILSGSLLYEFNGVAGGWTSGLAATFGFIIFMIGLNMLKSGLDGIGQEGIGSMRVGAIIGAISSLLDLIPFIGWISGIGFLAAFIFILLGLLRLKRSDALGFVGREGAGRLVWGKAVAIFSVLVSLIPFFGSIVASVLMLVSMYLSFSGWLRIQDGLLESDLSPEVSY